MRVAQLIVRVDSQLLEAIDEYAGRINQAVPEVRVTRSAAARELLKRALREAKLP